jgi:hypothetical protein
MHGSWHGYWTGLNDQKTEGTYVWADGSSADNAMIRWNAAPDDWHGNEDCTNIYYPGLYNDLPCEAKTAIICELVNPGNVPCPSGWMTRATPSTNDCYLIADDTLKLTHSEATQYCVRHSTKLVTATLLAVNDVAEAAWINATLAKLATNHNYRGIGLGWWTGLNDRQSKGMWLYPDTFNNPVDMSLINWYGEPYDPTGTLDCNRILWGGSYMCVDCAHKLGFVYERLPLGNCPNPAASTGSGYRPSSHQVVLVIMGGIVTRLVNTGSG